MNLSRRDFFKLSGQHGMTTALIVVGGTTLLTTEAVARTSREEKDRKKNAKYTMTLATAYIVGASRSYPIMQLDLKENIQNLTNGEVYVKLAPGGQLGAGGALVQKVQAGTIQAAQHSISNFAAFAPPVDLINVPYWVGKNQQFVNLVTSNEWKKTVETKVEKKGFKPLFYVCIDPRVVALRKGVEGPIKTPDQLKGIKFRVPGSQILQKMYRLLGASPTPIAWGETPSAIKQGVADALDPSVEALNIFGFKEILSSVTFNQAVPDAQVYSCNIEWLKSLPSRIQDGILEASSITFEQNLAKVPAARAYSMSQLGAEGVEFYTPNDSEMKQWVDAAGHQRDDWTQTKKDLAGSIKKFDKLLTAANTKSRFNVDDV
jgi:TRAP-type C4-dicarboxylate transport system substrate-binding protein